MPRAEQRQDVVGAGRLPAMRYVYLGDRATDPALKGQPCDPVLRPDGKRICGRGSQLVRFADGAERAVIRRRLRVVSRLPRAREFDSHRSLT